METQICCALRFYATGSLISVLGDASGLSKASVSRLITSVTEAICTLAEQYIQFPTTEQNMRKESQLFHAMAGFPNVVGAIDGSLMRISKPSAEREPAFVCRKGYHALNVQVFRIYLNVRIQN